MKHTPGWTEYPIPLANANANANAGDLRTDPSGRLWFEEDAGQIALLDHRSGFVSTSSPAAARGEG